MRLVWRKRAHLKATRLGMRLAWRKREYLKATRLGMRPVWEERLTGRYEAEYEAGLEKERPPEAEAMRLGMMLVWRERHYLKATRLGIRLA